MWVMNFLPLLLALILSVYSWTEEGPTGKVSHVEHGSSHESKLFRMKLLNAFRSVDPHVEDGMVNRFYRFYRNPA
ncbi:hypothetical protein WR25_16765 [Diploscapter pachys]|uniref:Uncharacterized protein n=1 Tax=Diploscapter pachys TaxID=2018661 RepID=A0A2A2L870_9BILA|nr:hypothetical protein WR25_16765 [Diploscapter pachys]